MSNPSFYRDFGRPDVERFARMICSEFGRDPEEMVPETGYPDAPSIPLWWKYQGDAIKFIACMKAAEMMS